MTTTLLPNTATSIGSWARFIAQGLEASHVDSRQLFLDAGIELDESENANVRFPVQKMSRVWQLAVERTGDPCFPLTLASYANPGMYSALGLSMISSRTLGEAISRCCRFSQIASDAATLTLAERDDGEVEMVYRLSAEGATLVTHEAMEAFLATTTQILRNISNNGFAPLAVHFCHNKKAHRRAYEEFFRAPLFFDALEYKIVFPRAALDGKCGQANPELAANMDAWMNEYLERFDAASISVKVRRLLAEKLPDGEIKQSELASTLAMSTRSLQRSLQKEGVSFKELLEITRQDLALKYIGEKQLSIIEVCCLLGFSDQSNFTKAFKRWTGQTPYSYRQGLAA